MDLAERLKVARHERNQALDEKDEAVKKLYLEDQARKKAEMEVCLFPCWSGWLK